MRLNVGCGEFRQDGWLNIDVTRNDKVRPDLIAHATDLPFEDGSVARVYMGHVLEHLTKEDAIVALREARRVLEPGGRLCVVGPDLELALHLYPDDTQLHTDIRAGGGRWPGDAHLWDSTGRETAWLAIQSGWRCTEPYDISRVPDEWPVVSRIGWQFGMLATKEPL